MTEPLTPGEQVALDRILHRYESSAETIARVVGVTDAQAQQALALSSPATADHPALDDTELERLWELWAERIGVAKDRELTVFVREVEHAPAHVGADARPGSAR